MTPPDALPADAELALAWAGTLPIAGTLAGNVDQAALLDCLRVRFALSLYGSDAGAFCNN